MLEYIWRIARHGLNAYVRGWTIFVWKDHCHTLLPLPMPDDTQRLGRCPNCDERITTPWLLVEYEKDDGTEGIWAECPTCEDVVAPE